MATKKTLGAKIKTFFKKLLTTKRRKYVYAGAIVVGAAVVALGLIPTDAVDLLNERLTSASGLITTVVSVLAIAHLSNDDEA